MDTVTRAMVDTLVLFYVAAARAASKLLKVYSGVTARTMACPLLNRFKRHLTAAACPSALVVHVLASVAAVAVPPGKNLYHADQPSNATQASNCSVWWKNLPCSHFLL